MTIGYLRSEGALGKEKKLTLLCQRFLIWIGTRRLRSIAGDFSFIGYC